MREAPAVTLIERAARRRRQDRRRTIPVAMAEARSSSAAASATTSVNYDALEDADALLIVTEWNEFRNPDFERMKRAAASQPVIFDGRNLYEPAADGGSSASPTTRSAGRAVRGESDA